MSDYKTCRTCGEPFLDANPIESCPLCEEKAREKTPRGVELQISLSFNSYDMDLTMVVPEEVPEAGINEYLTNQFVLELARNQKLCFDVLRKVKVEVD